MNWTACPLRWLALALVLCVPVAASDLCSVQVEDLTVWSSLVEPPPPPYRFRATATGDGVRQTRIFIMRPGGFMGPIENLLLFTLEERTSTSFIVRGHCLEPGPWQLVGEATCSDGNGSYTVLPIEVPATPPEVEITGLSCMGPGQYKIEHVDRRSTGQATTNYSYSVYPRTPDGEFGPPVFFPNSTVTAQPGDKVQVQLTTCHAAPVWDTLIVPEKVSPKTTVTLKKGPKDPLTGRRKILGRIDYDMGSEPLGWSVRVQLNDHMSASGQFYAGRQLLDFTPAQQTGTETFELVPPSGAQQVTVSARVAVCNDLATSDASIDCGCDGGTNDPVYFADGNVRVTDVDALPSLAGRTLVRTYNSDEQLQGSFGRGWTTLLDRRMMSDSDGSGWVRSFVTETNEIVTFRGGVSYRQTWPTSRGASGTLVHDVPTDTFSHRAAGSNEIAVFRGSDGRLVALRDVATGREIQIGYMGPYPQTVTDSWTGTRWNLAFDTQRRRVTAITVEGRPDLVWSYTYDFQGNLTHVTAPGDATWRTYVYVDNRLTASYDPSGNLIEQHDYDANGYGISSTGPGDEVALIEYNLPGTVPHESVTRVTYKTGAVALYALRPAGGSYRPVRITGGCSSCGASDATYVHDAAGRVIREQDAGGRVTVRTYAAGSLASETRALRPAACDPATDPQQCRMTPEALASAVLQPTSATLQTTFGYDDPLWPDRMTSTVTASVLDGTRTRTETVTYDPATGQVLARSVRGWTGSPMAEEVRTTSTVIYDGIEDAAFAPGGAFDASWLTLPQPRQSKSTDGPRTDVSDITDLVYYPVHASVPATWRGRLAATRNALGHIQRYEDYDEFGNARRTVDANGVIVHRTYDAFGRLAVSTVKAVGGCDTQADPLCDTDLAHTRTYDGAGSLQAEERPGGGIASYAYDTRGRVSAISRGPSVNDLRERMETEYDPLTGRKSVERWLELVNGAWTERKRETHQYDGMGRPSAVVHADQTSVAYTYDAAGRLAAVRDENHAAANTRYRYDPAGRLHEVEQTLASAPDGKIVTRYGYDAHGNLTSVTDPNGNVTTYVFDDFGLMLRQNSPVSGETVYTYDEAGQVRTMTDANGATTTRTYDALGRVLTAVSQRGAASETVTWTYDAGAFGKGRLSTMTDPAAATSYAYDRRGLLLTETRSIDGITYATRFGYDADGDRTSMQYPTGRVVTQTFDHAGRPESMNAGAVAIVQAARYLPFGPLRELTMGNGTTKTMTYDNRYRPVTTVLSTPAGVVASYAYGHDAAGNVTSLQDALDPSYTRTFGYDDLHRLTTANTGSDLWGTGQFTYDAMGNTTSAILGSSVRTFHYQGGTPKLAHMSENGVIRSVAYDAAGNEMTAGTWTSSYSPRNLLSGARTASFAYDGRGVRTRAVVPEWPALQALEIADSVGGGRTIQGRIVINGPSPATGTAVALQSNASEASVPASVTVPAGAMEVLFDITTTAVSQPGPVSISASYGSVELTRSLIVSPAALDALTFPATTVPGGQSIEGLVRMTALAAAGGVVLQAASSHPAVLSVPGTISVAEGEDEAAFVATSNGPVPAATPVTITVQQAAETRQFIVTVLPPPVANLVVTPSTVEGGAPVSAVVTLESAAAAGTQITFESSNAALQAPAPLTMNAGATSAAAEVATNAVMTTQSAVLTATLAPTSATAAVVIQPPAVTLQSFTIGASSVVGSNIVNGTVTLTAPAPAGGLDVELSPFENGLVPPYVTVAAGATSATFDITTPLVGATEQKLLTARHGPSTITRTLEVQPPVTVEDIALYAPGTIPETEDDRRVGGSSFEFWSTTHSMAVEPAVATITGWTPIDPSGYRSVEAQAATVTQATDATIVTTHTVMQDRERVVIVPTADTIVLRSLAVEPSILGGANATATVTLSDPAPAGGFVVPLSGTRPGLATVPASVTVPAGETTAAFTVTTQQTTFPRGVLIRATHAAQLRTAVLSVEPGLPSRAPVPPSAETSSLVAGDAPPIAMTISMRRLATSGVPEKRYLYTPELNLMVEATVTNDTSAFEHEYLWFGGQPVAQIESATGSIHYYFNDHLGTPILTTNATGAIDWRVEREPYGTPYALRAGTTRHQPLSFPGQETSDLEITYNVFRWYTAGWGRYTQADPLGELRASEPNLYRYARANSIRVTDPLGLWAIDKSCDGCPGGYSFGGKKAVQDGVNVACNNFLKKPKCASLIENLQFSKAMDTGKFEPLGPCMRRLCDGDNKIYCAQNTDPQNPEACAKANPFGAITMMSGAGTGNCYFDKGAGWSHTVFHEMVHICGLTDTESESYGTGPYSKLFQKIMWTCAGVLN